MNNSKPQVGEVINIQHAVAYDKKGNPFITGSKRFVDSRVEAVYHHGAVRVSSGDVWHVRRMDDGKLATALVA